MSARNHRQSGNIFFALFGAVGLIGVLGAASMTILKGPVRSMAEVTKRTVAENAMIAAGRLSLSAATQAANGGDCDGDGYIEPVEWSTTGTGVAPVGGGFIPASIGAAQQDPWGTTYGYCAWDHGSAVDAAGCGGATQKRLDGEESEDYAAIAVISAGANRTFETSCNDTPDYLTRVSGSDDIILEYTYGESSAMGLWRLKSGDPDTAEIGARNIEVAGSGGAGAARIGYDADLDMAGVGDFLAIKTDHVYAQTDGGDVTFHNLLKVASIESLGAPVAGGIAQDADEFDNMIAAFAGACPDGWTEATDLAGRMIIGAGTLGSDTYVVGDTGGEATVTLTTAQLPSHTHSVDPPSTSANTVAAHTHQVDPPSTGTNTTGAHTHGYAHAPGNTLTGVGSSGSPPSTGNQTTSAGDHAHTVNIASFASGSGGSHDHTVDIAAFNSTAAGSGTAHENRPPYRAYTWCSFDGDFSVYVSGDTLDALSCSSGQIAKYDGSIWECAVDIGDVGSDTLGSLSCASGEIAKWNGSAWACAADGEGSSLWTENASNIYFNTGNVGIGTITPSAALHVATADPASSIILQDSATNRAGRVTGGSDGSGGYLAFETGNAPSTFNERMRISATGNVGIGTDSPSYRLHVVEGGANTYAATLDHTNATNSNGLYIRTQTTNPADLALNVTSNAGADPVLVARNDGKVGIGTSSPSTLLHVKSASSAQLTLENGGTSSSQIIATGGDGNLNFLTSGGTRLRIMASGRVGIGTTDPNYPLEVNGDIYTPGWIRTGGIYGWYSQTYGGGWYMSDSTWVRVYNSKWVYTAGVMRADAGMHTSQLCSTSGTNCIAQSTLYGLSLRAAKDDIRDLPLGLDAVMKLRPVAFTWAVDTDLAGRKDFGFVAEEVEKVDPLLAKYEDGKLTGVKYIQMSTLAIKAVQELKILFDELIDKVAQLFDTTAQHEKRIAALEEENRDLRARLDDIESTLTQEAR